MSLNTKMNLAAKGVILDIAKNIILRIENDEDIEMSVSFTKKGKNKIKFRYATIKKD